MSLRVVSSITELKGIIKEWKKAGQSIGLVPTMGYLHQGHQSLIQKAASQNDRVIVSVFVNPKQFAPGEDLAKYPRDIKNDQQKAQQAGADLIFHPDDEEMYPADFDSFVQVNGLTSLLEGKIRPTHFRGVVTVLTKLFNLTQADRAYFGQKDAQQVAVVKKLVSDLDFPIRLVVCPIVRRSDGLALSSRNSYLSKDEDKAAVVLYQSLELADRLYRQGTKNSSQIIQKVTDFISKEPLADIDYVKIVDEQTFLDKADLSSGSAIVLLAVKIGKVRLIDNWVLGDIK
ncbi:pantoate--beta-alanine ligase [Oenococcus alcoholitolerans]|uniref:pantoate--beta-alanine ligase n=1 Tax=Oenococcus alcoholitolerans TaxID=931074 RepID=UPI003F6F437D